MKTLRSRLLFAVAMLTALACQQKSEDKPARDADAPVAEKVPFELAAHGNKRVDNYYWMKLSDKQKNAEQKDEQTKKVIDYLNAENAYIEKR